MRMTGSTYALALEIRRMENMLTSEFRDTDRKLLRMYAELVRRNDYSTDAEIAAYRAGK